MGFFAGFLGQFGLLDLLFQFLKLVTALFSLAKLLLDGLHLLVQIIFALGLLHLPLDPAADALFHLQDANLALHDAIDLFQPLGDAHGL